MIRGCSSIVLLAAAIACHSTAAPAIPGAVKGAASPEAQKEPLVPPSSSSARNAVPRLAEALVVKWNAAHSSRDASALKAIYAPELWYYGERLTREKCVKQKAATFASNPDFAQSIIDPTYMDDGTGGYYVTFTKITTSHGSSRRRPTYLYLGVGNIVAEGDFAPTPDPLERPCINITPDGWFLPNDAIVAPYVISALDAVRGTVRSKHLAALRTKLHARALEVSVVACAGAVDANGEPENNYALSVDNPDWAPSPSEGALGGHPTLVVSAFVDAITRTLSWDDGAASETLPVHTMPPITH